MYQIFSAAVMSNTLINRMAFRPILFHFQAVANLS